MAHDLIIQVHREYGHIKSKKMNNLIGLKFEIKNCLEISQKVVEVCHICDTTGVQPCGLQRKDLSRDPTLIRYPGAVFYVDELQIVSRETGSKMVGFHKVLIAYTDVWPHLGSSHRQCLQFVWKFCPRCMCTEKYIKSSDK